MDCIELTAFTVPCVLGVLEREQRVTQPLSIELELFLDLSGAAGGDLARSVDYAAVADQVRTVAQQGQWRLLESMGAAICRLLLAPPAPQEARAPIDRVRLRLRKPEILDGAVPGVVLDRDAAWAADLELASITTGVGAEVLQDTPLVGAYRIHLDPGTTWEPPPSLALHLLAGRPLVDGQVALPGLRLARGAGVSIESYDKQPVSFLGVSRPPLF